MAAAISAGLARRPIGTGRASMRGPSTGSSSPPASNGRVDRSRSDGVEPDTGLAPGADAASHGTRQRQLGHAVDRGPVDAGRTGARLVFVSIEQQAEQLLVDGGEAGRVRRR